MKEVFVLLADTAGTMRSGEDPFGVAVTNEAEAKKFSKKRNIGYSQSYQKVRIFETEKEAVEHYMGLDPLKG